MWIFIFGYIGGMITGVILMALLQIGRGRQKKGG